MNIRSRSNLIYTLRNRLLFERLSINSFLGIEVSLGLHHMLLSPLSHSFLVPLTTCTQYPVPVSWSQHVIPKKTSLPSGKGKGVCRFLLGAEGLRTNVEEGVKLLDDMVAENESIVIFNLFSRTFLLFLRICSKPLPSRTCVWLVPLLSDVTVT